MQAPEATIAKAQNAVAAASAAVRDAREASNIASWATTQAETRKIKASLAATVGGIERGARREGRASKR